MPEQVNFFETLLLDIQFGSYPLAHEFAMAGIIAAWYAQWICGRPDLETEFRYETHIDAWVVDARADDPRLSTSIKLDRTMTGAIEYMLKALGCL